MDVRIDEAGCWTSGWDSVRMGCTLDLSSLEKDGITPRSVKQVHGNLVLDDETYLADQKADGLATKKQNTLLLIRTADCVPVHLADDLGIAMIHAGWRGTRMGIVCRVLRHFDLDRVFAVIGPSIGFERYEVDRDLYEDWQVEDPALHDFLRSPGNGTSKRLFDLKGFVRKQLVEAGISADRVFTVPVCTYDALLPSYRRDGKKRGNLFNYIYRIG